MKLIVNGQELCIPRSNARKYISILDDCEGIKYCSNFCNRDGWYCSSSRLKRPKKSIMLINMYTGVNHYCCTDFRSTII